MYLSKGEEMTNNPLQKYFRKPAIYIKLPTGVDLNPEIDTTARQDGVLPMTAIGEITLKNPDELLNGWDTLNLIKVAVLTFQTHTTCATLMLKHCFLLFSMQRGMN